MVNGEELRVSCIPFEGAVNGTDYYAYSASGEKIQCPAGSMPQCLIAPAKPNIVISPRKGLQENTGKDATEITRIICEADAACPTDPIYLRTGDKGLIDPSALNPSLFTSSARNCFEDDQVGDCIMRYFDKQVEKDAFVINPEAEKTTSAAVLQKLLTAQPAPTLIPLSESGASDARWTSERFTKFCRDKGFTPGKNCGNACPGRIAESDWGRCGPKPESAGRPSSLSPSAAPSPLFQYPSLPGSPRVFSNPLQLRNLSIHYSI